MHNDLQGTRRRGEDENLAEWVVEITSAAHKDSCDIFVEGYSRYACCCQPYLHARQRLLLLLFPGSFPSRGNSAQLRHSLSCTLRSAQCHSSRLVLKHTWHTWLQPLRVMHLLAGRRRSAAP